MAARKKAAGKKPAKRAPARRVKEQPNAAQLLVERLRSTKGKKKSYVSKVTTLAEQKQADAQVKEFIPFGIDVLDNYVLGRGGNPVGRMTEIFGEEGCGKTALLYRALGCAQRLGGVSALVDAEFSFDDERAGVHGINQGDLVMGQLPILEEALEFIKDTIGYHNPKHGPLLLGVDSIASLNTRNGVSMAAGDTGVAEAARIFSDEMRDLPKLLHAHRAHIIWINQIRHKMGVRFGSNITTPGGNAPKFYCSTRLQFFGGKGIKNSAEEHIGKVVTIMAIKNRMCSPFRKARVRFDYATGYNNQWTTIEHAKRLKLVKPRDKGHNGKGKAGPNAYIEALEALDWDINPIGPLGLEQAGDPSDEVSDDDDADADDDDDSDED